ncbi:hypothetical protein MRX96_051578 [Rhipicephalus microplus]
MAAVSWRMAQHSLSYVVLLAVTILDGLLSLLREPTAPSFPQTCISADVTGWLSLKQHAPNKIERLHKARGSEGALGHRVEELWFFDAWINMWPMCLVLSDGF